MFSSSSRLRGFFSTISRKVASLNALYARRKWLANKMNLPAYNVFSDATLREMVEKKPLSLDELLNISGVVERKAARYGTTFLRIIEDAVENRE